MDIIQIDNDITVFYVAATSFPGGILQAHQDLHARVPFSTSRRYFGISRPENGQIKYKAAAEELTPGEGAQYQCDTIVLKKGRYASKRLNNYMEQLQRMESIFQELLQEPGLDPNGYCVEWYINNKDMICMVRLAES